MWGQREQAADRILGHRSEAGGLGPEDPVGGRDPEAAPVWGCPRSADEETRSHQTGILQTHSHWLQTEPQSGNITLHTKALKRSEKTA